MFKTLNNFKSEFTKEQMYLLDTIGLVVVHNFVTEDIVSQINEIIDIHTSIEPKPSKFAFFTLDPIFMDLMSHPWIMGVCRHALGDWFRFDHVVGIQQPGMIKSEKTGQWVDQGYDQGNLHGGVHSSQGSCFYHSSAKNTWVGQMSFGISLTGQNKESGGFCYVPGSHKQSTEDSGSKIFKDSLSGNYSSSCLTIPELKPGSIVCFSESLIHGTTPLVRPHIRRSLYYKYVPGFCAWRSYDEIKHYLNYARTDLQKQLLRAPFVGNIKDDEGFMSDNIMKTPTKLI